MLSSFNFWNHGGFPGTVLLTPGGRWQCCALPLDVSMTTEISKPLYVFRNQLACKTTPESCEEHCVSDLISVVLPAISLQFHITALCDHPSLTITLYQIRIRLYWVGLSGSACTHLSNTFVLAPGTWHWRICKCDSLMRKHLTLSVPFLPCPCGIPKGSPVSSYLPQVD